MAVSSNDVAFLSLHSCPLSAFIHYLESLQLVVRYMKIARHIKRLTDQTSLGTTDIKDKAVNLAMRKSYTNIR